MDALVAVDREGLLIILAAQRERLGAAACDAEATEDAFALVNVRGASLELDLLPLVVGFEVLAADFRDARVAMAFEPLGYFRRDAAIDVGPVEDGGSANLHRARAGHEEINGIRADGDARRR